MVIKNKIMLPDNYRRSLSVTARHIEKSIDSIEELLTNRRNENHTEKLIRSLTDEMKQKILELLSTAKIRNEKMFDDLELNVYTTYEERIVRSNIGHIWTLLCDSSPEALKGYGDISNQQAELIRFHVNSLLETIDAIQTIIK